MIRLVMSCAVAVCLSMGCSQQKLVQVGPGNPYQLQRIGSRQASIQLVRVLQRAEGVEVEGMLRNNRLGNVWPDGHVRVTIIGADGKVVAEASTDRFDSRSVGRRSDRALRFRVQLPQLPTTATIRVEHLIS